MGVKRGRFVIGSFRVLEIPAVDGWLSFYRRGDYAVTLVYPVVMGGLLAVILAVGRVSGNKFIRFHLFCLRIFFRGTPLYVQLLVFYSGMYTLEIVKGTDRQRDFSPADELYRTGADAEYTSRTTGEIFAGAIRSVPRR